jgi:hypothetical protein
MYSWEICCGGMNGSILEVLDLHDDRGTPLRSGQGIS